jgi:phosphatidylserine/phosphatidylglycerophosphate/cardiolipin synthase-like enzyme
VSNGRAVKRGALDEDPLDFIRPSRPVPVELLAGRAHYDRVVRAAMGAARSVWIATATLKALMVEDERARPGRRRTMRASGVAFRSILEVFAEQAARGVEIRILHGGDPSRPFREELRRQGRRGAPGSSARQAPPSCGACPELRQCPRVHLKLVIVDGAEVYLGSANWTGAGLGAKGAGRRNFELGVLSRDDLLLDETQRIFDHVWRGAACHTCRLRARPDLCPRPIASAPGDP